MGNIGSYFPVAFATVFLLCVLGFNLEWIRDELRGYVQKPPIEKASVTIISFAAIFGGVFIWLVMLNMSLESAARSDRWELRDTLNELREQVRAETAEIRALDSQLERLYNIRDAARQARIDAAQNNAN